MNQTYLLDANIFIEAKNRYYGFDFCPAFWEWLLLKNKEGKVYSHWKVYEELNKGNDELKDWVSAEAKSLFLKPSDDILMPSFAKLSELTLNLKDYKEGAISEFFASADYYLIAFALSKGYTLVTHEVSSPSKKRIKIPDIARQLQIATISPFEMLRTENARFIINP